MALLGGACRYLVYAIKQRYQMTCLRVPRPLKWISKICLALFCFIFALNYLNIVFVDGWKPYRLGQGVCKIPKFEVWDSSILKFYGPEPPVICIADQPQLTYLEDQKIYFNQSALLLKYDSSKNLICKYRCFSRPFEDDETIDWGEWQDFHTEVATQVFCEFINVVCNISNVKIYDEIHAQIVVNKSRIAEIKDNLDGKKRYDVIVIVFDAISRLNMLRTAPKIVDVLQNLYKTTILEGFTKLGDNSWPNGYVFLTGQDYKDLDWQYGSKLAKMYLDDIGLIWHDYHKDGYVTTFAEDIACLNLFNFAKHGFKHKPTDHQMRPFWLACRQNDWYDPTCWPCKHEVYNFCFQNHKKHSLLFKYVEQYIQRYTEVPKFLLNWNIIIGHENLTGMRHGDEEFAEILRRNYDNLKESFLFVMGDHGQRLLPIRETAIGHFEDNMPFFSLALPQSFDKEHPEVRRNLEQNSKVLASFYDLHLTLIDILHSQNNGWGQLTSQKDWEVIKKTPHGLSLLRPLPQRTCEETGVGDYYCICAEEVPVSVEGNALLDIAAHVLIDYVNDLLGNYSSICATLEMSGLHSAYQLLTVMKVGRTMTRKYRLVVEASPSNALFEALLVEKERTMFEVSGEVSRINKYGNQSICVPDPVLRKYCYCF